MNDDYQKRMIIAFALSFVMLAVTFFLIPQQRKNQRDKAVLANTNANTNTALVSDPSNRAEVLSREGREKVQKEVVYDAKGQKEVISIAYDSQIYIDIDTAGAAMSSIAVSGEWNQYTNAIKVGAPTDRVRNGEIGFGDLNQLLTFPERPLYRVVEKSSNSAVLSTRVKIKDTPVEITKKITANSNYQIIETISFKNLSGVPVNVNFNNKSFTLGNSFLFTSKEHANSRNRFETRYYDGKKLHGVLARGGIFRQAVNSEVISRPDWMTMSDNYFLAIVDPLSNTFAGKFDVLAEEKGGYIEVAMGLENDPFVLEKGESRDFTISYYVGPKKEWTLRKINPTYKTIFAWPGLFNWLMKPMEWGMNWLMFALASFIHNWGLVIIVLALVIKALLMPLSVKSAISIKRMNLLQPKLKQLQEKYKDNQQVMQQKLAELYKKEGVNPLGGCWPMLLQIPVFFALFRVLSWSVELRGATFLWIKDLTLPDTLFTMNIPLLPKEFNLLPILMTAIQLVQTYLQQVKNPTMQQQNKLQTFLIPVLFLFLFWQMPSGLVLYWTIQNIYSIIEQQVVNVDKHVKLK